MIDRTSWKASVIGEGIQVDFDLEGSLIGVEIEHVEFHALAVSLKAALMNLAGVVTAEERRQVSDVFEKALAGNYKQLDPIS